MEENKSLQRECRRRSADPLSALSAAVADTFSVAAGLSA
jgi:hypothetical protein